MYIYKTLDVTHLTAALNPTEIMQIITSVLELQYTFFTGCKL